MKIEGSKITFSTGKTVDAYAGVIGVSPDLKMVTGGYDSVLHERDNLTQGEIIELTRHMIKQWRKLRTMLQHNNPQASN